METLLAREPIFDQEDQILGYRILHDDRVGSGSAHAALEALLELGVDRLAEGLVVFLDVTGEMLVTGAAELLEPATVVLVVAASDGDPVTLARIDEYASFGYRLAVPIDPDRPADPRMLEAAEIALVDVSTIPAERLTPLLAELRARHLTLMARGVDNATMRDECARLGFRIFQGYRHRQPEVVRAQALTVEHLSVFRLLKDLRDPDLGDAQIVDSFRRDPGLTYRLLRLVNSAAVGGQQVTSISYAIRLLGREAISRWLSLLLLAPYGEGGLSAEIATSAVVRARHCELLAEKAGRPWAADSLFTVGLFSRLDLLLQSSMERIVEQAAFSDELKSALLSHAGPDGEILALVEAYESGRWEEMERRAAMLHVASDEVARLYLEALSWGQNPDSADPHLEADGTVTVTGPGARREDLGIWNRLRSLLRRPARG